MINSNNNFKKSSLRVFFTLKNSFIQSEKNIQHFKVIFSLSIRARLQNEHWFSYSSPGSNSIFSLPLVLCTLAMWFSDDIPRANSNPVIALSETPQNDGCPLVYVWLRSSRKDIAALPCSSHVTSLRMFSHWRVLLQNDSIFTRKW